MVCGCAHVFSRPAADLDAVCENSGTFGISVQIYKSCHNYCCLFPCNIIFWGESCFRNSDYFSFPVCLLHFFIVPAFFLYIRKCNFSGLLIAKGFIYYRDKLCPCDEVFRSESPIGVSCYILHIKPFLYHRLRPMPHIVSCRQNRPVMQAFIQ
jgi:hypothetical protein